MPTSAAAVILQNIRQRLTSWRAATKVCANQLHHQCVPMVCRRVRLAETSVDLLSAVKAHRFASSLATCIASGAIHIGVAPARHLCSQVRFISCQPMMACLAGTAPRRSPASIQRELPCANMQCFALMHDKLFVRSVSARFSDVAK